jgi:ParB family chromosome partitioning protein
MNATESSPLDQLQHLPLEHIVPDPAQPRKHLGDLDGLTESLRSVGLIQPIVVEPCPDETFRILAGERRYTAARALGWKTIPAIVRSQPSHRCLEEQLLENLHRKNLNPFEEAEAFRRLIDEFGLSQHVLGRRLGRSQVSVSETLALLRLPEWLKKDYRTSDTLPRSLLLAIARQPDERTMRVLWERARHGKLTVRAARRFARRKGPRRTDTVGFRYPIQTEAALVTVSFSRHRATLEEIVGALEEALEGERQRLQATGRGTSGSYQGSS